MGAIGQGLGGTDPRSSSCSRTTAWITPYLKVSHFFSSVHSLRRCFLDTCVPLSFSHSRDGNALLPLRDEPIGVHLVKATVSGSNRSGWTVWEPPSKCKK